ncbi:alanine--tRNA ligase, partial [Candidatus Pacearchaeota archaeon]|nr:alanine--tRNA ligase [Candidatus Pacearchaeota archaeon]
KDNWWGPAGATGPCGPDTEMFYWKSQNTKPPKKFNPEDKNWVEIWNDVFMQYVKTKDGKFIEASQKNVDTGMGVERTVAVLNGLEDNYLGDSFKPIIEKILEISNGFKSYNNNERVRIIADHIKASVFIIAEGVTPSNTERGYVVRRLIRRAVRHGIKISLKDFTDKVAEAVFDIYEENYSELKENKEKILEVLRLEEKKFNETLDKGLRVFDKKVQSSIEEEIRRVGGTKNYDHTKIKSFGTISGKEAFLLYQSYGFPFELIEEEAKNRKFKVNIKKLKKDFESEQEKHQELSRTATKGKFAAGLADHSEQSTKYHTATHMLHKALKVILGEEVQQMGSNITPERLRFDFNFPRKLTNEEIKKIEDLINKEIKKKLRVSYEEMPYEKAIKSGALSYFRERYPPIVKVYSVGDYSKEICTGPHVENTSTMGKFKITKEEAVSAGVRRIKAILE